MQKTVNSFVCAVMRLGEKPQPKKISRADPRKIQESLTAWSNVKELSFHLAGHEDCMIADVMELLQCFVKAKAFPPLAGSSSPSGSLTLGALAPDSQRDIAEFTSEVLAWCKSSRASQAWERRFVTPDVAA